MKYFYIIWFYSFLGIQGYAICNFWTFKACSMNFASFCLFEICLNLFDSGHGHVALSYLTIPVRSDQAFGPLDLKGI
jgi:hypothetical protein